MESEPQSTRHLPQVVFLLYYIRSHTDLGQLPGSLDNRVLVPVWVGWSDLVDPNICN